MSDFTEIRYPGKGWLSLLFLPVNNDTKDIEVQTCTAEFHAQVP